MDNLPRAQVRKTLQNAFRYLSKNLLTRPPPQLSNFSVDAVQTSALAELHGNRYRPGRQIVEGAIVLADIFRGTFAVVTQFSLDLLPDFVGRIGGDDLEMFSGAEQHH